MSEKHSPGPWAFYTYGASAYVFAGEREEAVCDLDYSQNGQGQDEETRARELVRANARLIAAAPDLLAALRACAEWHGPTCDHHRDECPDGCPTRPVDDAINAAINKAGGPLMIPALGSLEAALTRAAYLRAARAICINLCAEDEDGDEGPYPIMDREGYFWHLNGEPCPAGAIHALILAMGAE